VDNRQSLDLSGFDPVAEAKKNAAKSAPAGTVDPNTATPATNPAPSTKSTTGVQRDTPALAADEGRVFVPGAPYPGAVQDTTSGTTATPDTSQLAGNGDKGMGPTPETGMKKTDPVVDQNTLLINSLTEMAHKVTDQTSSILQAQKDASSALNSGFLDLTASQQAALDAADQLRKNTGQASRKPSYSLSMAKNRQANANGLSSTMLTGTGGVPTNQLALGRAQLLGGAPA
jgi:hypothetical protein